MARVLTKGNEAIAEAILQAGCEAFFAYPITPQNEIPEYCAREMPKRGQGFFLQAESEVAGINMIWGAAATGARVVTTTSGPGLSLMLEAVSSLSLTRIPCVIVNVMRSGPGMGDLAPAQEDINMRGNGAYRVPILLPGNVQEAANMVYEAFDIADQYWTPVIVMADGMIGQMMEAVDFDKLPPRRENLPEKTWRLAGTGEKGYRTKMSIHYDYKLTEATDILENESYPAMIANETRWEANDIENADIVLTAYGTAARMCSFVKKKDKYKNINIGIIRPKTYWPFPYLPYEEIGDQCKAILCAEINIMGELIDQVKVATKGRFPVVHVGNRKEGILNTKFIEEALDKLIAEVM